LILSITETGARMIEPGWTMNPLGNWWFDIGIAVLFTGLGWIVTERIVAPRLGAWRGDGPATSERLAAQLTTAEQRGLWAAGLAALGVAGLFAALSLWPGFTPLYDEAATPGQRLVRFPIVRSTAVMVLLSAGGEDGAVLDGFAHSRVSGL
jgi:aminobenzoyl-glutamate transport protein